MHELRGRSAAPKVGSRSLREGPHAGTRGLSGGALHGAMVMELQSLWGLVSSHRLTSVRRSRHGVCPPRGNGRRGAPNTAGFVALPPYSTGRQTRGERDCRRPAASVSSKKKSHPAHPTVGVTTPRECGRREGSAWTATERRRHHRAAAKEERRRSRSGTEQEQVRRRKRCNCKVCRAWSRATV